MWFLYDLIDGMFRFYVCIIKVIEVEFKVCIMWFDFLEDDSDNFVFIVCGVF